MERRGHRVADRCRSGGERLFAEQVRAGGFAVTPHHQARGGNFAGVGPAFDEIEHTPPTRRVEAEIFRCVDCEHVCLV